MTVKPRSPWILRHWLITTLVLLGLLMRVVVMLAYQPALLFPDSFRYLAAGRLFYLSQARPGGYGLVLFLSPVLHFSNALPVITAGQHLLGLAMAVGGYMLLVRRGLPLWGASLAVVPILFDPLQLVLEQYILSDLLFEALLVAICLVLLWHHRPGTRTLVVAGLAVGFAGLTRGAGSFLLVVVLLALVCLRLRWRAVAAFVVAAVLPMCAYAFAYQQVYGQFALVGTGPRFLYARLAPHVHCHTEKLPSYERSLCPKAPVGQRPDSDYFMWGRGRGPAYHVVPPAGMTSNQVIKDFDLRVIRAEPLLVARAIAQDVARGFASSRETDVAGFPASYWLFEDHNWSLDPFHEQARLYGTTYPLRSVPAAAKFLTAYRQVIYLPGPLAAALLVVGVAAVAGLGRARTSGNRVAIALLIGVCVVPLLTGATFSGFSWRYQLPQIPLLPMAGALGLAAIFRGRAVGDRAVRDRAGEGADEPGGAPILR